MIPLAKKTRAKVVVLKCGVKGYWCCYIEAV
jgi:hypothetical protein